MYADPDWLFWADLQCVFKNTKYKDVVAHGHTDIFYWKPSMKYCLWHAMVRIGYFNQSYIVIILHTLTLTTNHVWKEIRYIPYNVHRCDRRVKNLSEHDWIPCSCSSFSFRVLVLCMLAHVCFPYCNKSKCLMEIIIIIILFCFSFHQAMKGGGECQTGWGLSTVHRPDNDTLINPYIDKSL